jgi:DNA polymerase
MSTGMSLDKAQAEERRRQLAALHEIVDACRRCAIGSTRTKVVCGVGNPAARLVLVGEGPGENEDRQGEPFVGRAGELLTKMLAAIGLRREDVFITNTIKCRATTTEGGRVANRAPSPDEMAHCREYLDRELALVAPRVVLALGAPAAKSFLGRDFSITRQRGIWYPGPGGTDLIVTFHPAYILRQTGGEIQAVKRLVWSDLLAVRAKLDEDDKAAAEEMAQPAAPAEPANLSFDFQ